MFDDFIEHDTEEEFRLNFEGRQLVASFAEALLSRNYDLGDNPSQVWNAAGFLVANNYSEYTVDETAVLLVFLVRVWDKIKAL